jgi:hypothetical protein
MCSSGFLAKEDGLIRKSRLHLAQQGRASALEMLLYRFEAEA